MMAPASPDVSFDAIPFVPVNPFLAVLQTLLVAVGAFVVLALVLSHLRYQALLKTAKENPAASEDDLCLLLSERMARGPFGLLLLSPAGGGSLHGLTEDLSATLRRDDACLPVRGGGLLLLLDQCERNNVPRVLERIGHLPRERTPAGAATHAAWPADAPEQPEGDPRHARLNDARHLLNTLQPGNLPRDHWVFPPPPGERVPEIPAEQLPLLDPLTRVLSGDRLDTALQKLMASQRRRVKPAGVILAGIDSLESYNETHGRSAGDAVLRGVADTLMLACRETDLVGRVSGDTFVVFVPGTSGEVAAVGKRLCDAVRDTPVAWENETLRVTVGVGMAVYPNDGSGPSRLLGLASLALDTARGRGRGICLRHDPSMHPPRAQGKMENVDTPDSF